MLRLITFVAAVLILTVHLQGTSAQTTTAPAATAAPAAGSGSEAKPSRIKLTVQKLKEMKAKWSANKPKLKACRQEVKQKGLVGDHRWFYISDCMDKS
jgi:Spy/CpxP family protein refolding chaperone